MEFTFKEELVDVRSYTRTRFGYVECVCKHKRRYPRV